MKQIGTKLFSKVFLGFDVTHNALRRVLVGLEECVSEGVGAKRYTQKSHGVTCRHLGFMTQGLQHYFPVQPTSPYSISDAQRVCIRFVFGSWCHTILLNHILSSPTAFYCMVPEFARFMQVIGCL